MKAVIRSATTAPTKEAAATNDDVPSINMASVLLAGVAITPAGHYSTR
jgi:hypothetical protein